MKRFRDLSLFTILMVLVTFSMKAQHAIVGDSEACYGDCKTYNLSGGVGGPYYWKSTGEIEGTNQGSTVEICWNTIGSNEITLVDFSAPFANQVVQIEVDVAAIPEPKIITPKYPTCGRKDTLDGTIEQEFQVVECISACSESVAFYGFEDNHGANVDWEVEGGVIISQSFDGITVQWDLAGHGFIKLTESNSFGCVDSTFYCVDILDPLDIDILAFNGGTNSINVCTGQEVYLQALGSEDVTSFEWNLGNGSFDYGANASVSYDQGGTYDVMLIGSTECKCFDTTYYQIIVESNPGPEITCIGTTCGNEDHTYYAANTCSTYNWNISGNGSIVDGGGSSDGYVTVNWSSGPVGTVGLSTSGCSEAVCASETVVQIPILDGSAIIEGPTVACKSGYSNYSTQYYNGTDYNWNITGNGYIIDGWGTNQITVEWQDNPWSDDNSTITVDYENCYLECSGQASIDVELKPEFSISIPDVACTDKNTYFYGVNGWDLAVVSWTITSPSGIVRTYPNIGNFNDVFTETGIYSVSAIDDAGDFCNHEVRSFFEVVQTPLAPVSIEGPLVICKNEFYTYSVSLPAPNVTVTWNVYDGNTYRQIKANTASIQWTSNGPYEIRVNYTLNNGNCRSDDFTVQLEAAENATISGPSMGCVDEVLSYNVNATNGSPPVWSVIPSDAGSIIHNPDNSIDIMWHSAGNHQIESDYCGTNLVYNVSIAPLGVNSVTYIEEVCPGDLSTITSVVPVGSSIVIRDDLNNIVGTSSSENVSNGIYTVEITSTDGCVEEFPVVIDTFLPPSVRVSSPHENAFCLPYPDLSIVALDTKDGYTYEWYRDNVAMGINTSSISTNVYGGYHVVVTDKNGCTATSNVHRLYEWCDGDPPPGTCTGGGSGPINPDEIYLKCNNLQFTVNGAGMSSTSFTWQFGDPDSGDDNISSETSPIHEFSSAGYFYVFVQGNVPGENGVDIFTVPAAPRFDYERACAGNAVQFRNHSTFIPGFTITDYTWNFGDPSSGADNTSNAENPLHTFDNPGTYTVTLDISSSNGCLSTYELDVIVEPGPFAEFILPSTACSDDGVYFEAFPSTDIIKYEWDFDDPASGDANSSNNPNAIHTFSANGIFNVTLSVHDEFGCIQSISKPVEVSNSTISGDITADKAIPICFGDDVTLSAPGGGNAYLWSDGSVGQTITVDEPGIYYVTISDNTGCDFVPEPFSVVVEGMIDARIRATHLVDDLNWVSYYDSLEICEGEEFNLSTPWISGATYAWSNSFTSSYIYHYEMSTLTPGRHDFTVSITDPNSGCEIESDPLTIIVHALPDPIQLSSSTINPCEGEEHTLTIDNPDPNLLYSWSNGGTGHSTQVSMSGNYKVTAKNKNGCEITSSSISVSPLPDANRINVGCMEACFPDTMCIPSISGAAGYQWLYNGSPMTGVNANSMDLIADQAGDYQLVVSSWNGCIDTSDVVSIEAEPSDQSVSGIVFIDDNNNGIWDVGEELLAGVTINLYAGNTFETTVTTDAAGYYNFDPVDVTNPRIEIDTTGLGLNLTGGLFEDDIEFLDCIEDKEKDFPLIKECLPSNETMIMYTCKDETITINSIVLAEGDDWTFDDLNVNGCDSTTYVLVEAFPEADVNLTPIESCQNMDNGMLDITIMTGSDLEFSVDNNSSYTNNVQFNGLAPGMHMLWVSDANGCVKTYEFEIDVFQAPQMNTVVQNTCVNEDSGTAEIIPTLAGTYQYSLDGVNYASSNLFTDLAVGNYTIFVQDINLCTYEYPFSIAANPEPMFDLNTENSCVNGASGSLDIVALSGGTYNYSFNNVTFSSQTTFTDLPVGSWLLYVQELNGCTHIYPFEIQPKTEPNIDVVTTNTCEGENLGSISISPLTNGDYEYSIDGINYTSNLDYSGLGEGIYTVYLQEDGVCEFQFPAAISAQPEPNVSIETTDACIGDSNGSAIVNTSETGLSYSFDQITYVTEATFENLSAGLHIIYILAENGCVHPFEFEIFESEDLEVVFIDPIVDCSVQSVNLSPNVLASTGELRYAWNTGSTDSTHVVENSGQYTLEVSDQCSKQEYTWDIQLEEVTREQPIYIPNIFSPNQDGINECFVPVPRPETTILDYRLIIFDRWGNKFFETTDLNECWDGTYKGSKVRTGVFVYMIEMDYTYCVEVEKLKKYGDVTIVY